MTEPAQTAERAATLDDALARLPRLDMAYKVPPSSSPDDDALSVLSDDPVGRPQRAASTRAIVRQKQLATNVSAVRRREPRARACSTSWRPSRRASRPTDLEAAIDEEIEKVKTGPIADWEIEKARTGARRASSAALGSSLQRAVLLSQYAMFYNDPDRINTRADSIAKVTAADVQRVARAVPGQDRPHGGRHGAQGRAKPRREVCDGEPHHRVGSPAWWRRGARRWRRQPAARRPQPPPVDRPRWLLKKGKAPVSTRGPEGQAAAAEEADLPNGLHLMVLEDHRLPQVSFQILIPGAGGYYDPADTDWPRLATPRR